VIVRGQFEVFSKSSDLDPNEAVDNQDNRYCYPVEKRACEKSREKNIWE
jgi:hypothetical protein